MDRMIEYMNANHGDEFQLRYSTPSNYIDEIAKLDHNWPTTYTDFFPYHDFSDAYWGGFFTSRPLLKYHIKILSHKFHASAKLYSMNSINSKTQASQISEQSKILNGF